MSYAVYLVRSIAWKIMRYCTEKRTKRPELSGEEYDQMIKRVEEIRKDNEGHPLSAVDKGWSDHEQRVIRNLPNFGAEMYILESPQVKRYRNAYEKVAKGFIGPTDLDKEHGSRIVSLGKDLTVTRSAIDSNAEFKFLQKNLPDGNIGVLDIGAGYGRFVRFLSRIKRFSQIYAVDAIPVSTYLCEEYCTGTKVQTLMLRQFEDKYPELDIDLVINTHSWNECTYDQAERWLEYIGRTKARYLFTVTSNCMVGVPFHTQSAGYKSFLPLLEARYDKVAQEFSVLHLDCQRTLWKRKD